MDHYKHEIGKINRGGRTGRRRTTHQIPGPAQPRPAAGPGPGRLRSPTHQTPGPHARRGPWHPLRHPRLRRAPRHGVRRIQIVLMRADIDDALIALFEGDPGAEERLTGFGPDAFYRVMSLYRERPGDFPGRLAELISELGRGGGAVWGDWGLVVGWGEPGFLWG